MSCRDLVFKEYVGALRQEKPAGAGHRLYEMSVPAGTGPRRSTAHRLCIQGCGAAVTEVAFTSYCPNSNIPVFTCDSSAEDIKSLWKAWHLC